MGKNNIIEINGKRYEARTGALIDGVTKTAKRQSHHEPAPKVPSHAAGSPKHHPRTAVRSAAHPTGRKPHTSKTLMRHAVSKPLPTKRSLAAQAALDKQAAVIAPKSSVKALDHARLSKAKRVRKSKLIQHFAPIQAQPVIAAPVAQPDTVTHTPVHSNKPTTHKRRPKTTADVLEHALKHASSHTQPPIKPKRRSSHTRLASASLAIAIVIGALGFTVHQNANAVRLHMATAKAGISAQLPSYQPPGFSLDSVQSTQGVVVTTFASNSNDDRTYSVTQKRSTWDSEALRELFVAKTDADYQVLQQGGRTIYIYGSNHATWVTDSTWHIIHNDAGLTHRQLLQLATSL